MFLFINIYKHLLKNIIGARPQRNMAINILEWVHKITDYSY